MTTVPQSFSGAITIAERGESGNFLPRVFPTLPMDGEPILALMAVADAEVALITLSRADELARYFAALVERASA